MMRQTFDSDGRLLGVFTDNGDGTGTVTVYDPDTGEPVTTTGVTGLEVKPPYPPLDPTGVVVTLLVVEQVLTLEVGAAALRVEPDHLQHEALAWAAASALS